MIPLRTLLIGGSLAALATTAAVAQTSTQPSTQAPASRPQLARNGQMAPAAGASSVAPPSAPAAHGVQMPAPTQQTLTAPTSPDPLVQKRNADAQANAEYRSAKQASKAQYRQQVDNAKVNRQADQQAARNQLKTDMQAGHGPQTPDDETKH